MTNTMIRLASTVWRCVDIYLKISTYDMYGHYRADLHLQEVSFSLLSFIFSNFKIHAIVLMLVFSLIPFRQFKEQLRQQRHSEQISSSVASSSMYQRGHNKQLIHQQEQQQDYGTNVPMSSEYEHRASITSQTTTKATKTTSSADLRAQQQQAGITSKSTSSQQFDVKTIQKEAVLSYVKVYKE